jgi:hypothetical protein
MTLTTFQKKRRIQKHHNDNRGSRVSKRLAPHGAAGSLATGNTNMTTSTAPLSTQTASGSAMNLPNRLPLLPAHGVFLIVGRPQESDHPEIDGKAFARHFVAVWKRLPRSVRNKLLRYWRDWPPGAGRPAARVASRLRIELSRLQNPNECAYCAHEGWTLRFQPYLNLLQAYKVEPIIAHELAHAYRHAAGQSEPLEDVVASECDTIRIAMSWGFPQRPFRRADYRDQIKVANDIARAIASAPENGLGTPSLRFSASVTMT